MKRKLINSELRLLAPASHVSSDVSDYNFKMEEEEKKKKKPLTIFYNGRIASCDATEFQARAIIYLASKEMEENQNIWVGPSPILAVPNSSIYSPTTTTLSMKRSLQRFLEKRKSKAHSHS